MKFEQPVAVLVPVTVYNVVSVGTARIVSLAIEVEIIEFDGIQEYAPCAPAPEATN